MDIHMVPELKLNTRYSKNCDFYNRLLHLVSSMFANKLKKWRCLLQKKKKKKTICQIDSLTYILQDMQNWKGWKSFFLPNFLIKWIEWFYYNRNLLHYHKVQTVVVAENCTAEVDSSDSEMVRVVFVLLQNMHMQILLVIYCCIYKFQLCYFKQKGFLRSVLCVCRYELEITKLNEFYFTTNDFPYQNVLLSLWIENNSHHRGCATKHTETDKFRSKIVSLPYGRD